MTKLSAREMEVARLVAEGLADKEIACILMISVGTAKTHIDRIALKIGAKGSRRVAIALYVERSETPNDKNGEKVA